MFWIVPVAQTATIRPETLVMLVKIRVAKAIAPFIEGRVTKLYDNVCTALIEVLSEA